MIQFPDQKSIRQGLLNSGRASNREGKSGEVPHNPPLDGPVWRDLCVLRAPAGPSGRRGTAATQSPSSGTQPLCVIRLFCAPPQGSTVGARRADQRRSSPMSDLWSS